MKKKILLVVGVAVTSIIAVCGALSGCSQIESQSSEESIIMYQNGICFEASHVLPDTFVETKAAKSANGELLCLKATKDDVEYSEVIEIEEKDGVSFNRHYTPNGVLIATATVVKGQLIELDTDYDSRNDIELNASRLKGEKYFNCIRRNYKERKRALEDDFVNEVTCDFLSALCYTIFLFEGIIGCI